MTNKVYLAVDLGAGSGRLMAAVFDSKKIELEEVSRWQANLSSLAFLMDVKAISRKSFRR